MNSKLTLRWLCAIAAFVIGFAGIASATTWTEDERVIAPEFAIDGMSGPHIAAEPDGSIHLVCIGYYDGASHLLYSKWDGGVWSSPEVLVSAPNDVDLAVDGEGNIYVVWVSSVSSPPDFYRGVYYRKWDGTQWSAESRISADSTNASDVDVLADQDGNIHVAWVAKREPNSVYPLYYSRWGGSSWTQEVILSESSSSSPDMVVSPGGQVSLFWSGSSDNIWWRRWNGLNWGEAEQVTDAPLYAINCSAVADQAGGIHLVWEEAVQGQWETYRGIFYKRWDGQGWTSKEPLIVTWATGYDRPVLAADTDDAIHVVWGSQQSGHPSRLTYTRWDGLAWSTQIVLNPIEYNASQPFVSVDSGGNLHLVWIDNREGVQCVYHKLRKHCLDGDAYEDCRVFDYSGEPLFDTRYTAEADTFSVPIGEPVYYDSTMVTITRGENDRFFLTGAYGSLSGWACDDRIYIDGQNAGLGFDGIIDPSLPLCRPIDEVVGLSDPRDVTEFIPMGENCVSFKLADTQREVLGNTPIYLWRVDAAGVADGAAEFASSLTVWPNPVTETARLAFRAAHGGDVTMTLYSTAGRAIRRFSRSTQAGEEVVFDWDLRDAQGHRVAPGVYFVSSTGAGEIHRSTKMLIVR